MADLLTVALVDWVSLQDVVWYGTRGVVTPVAKALALRVLERIFDEGLMVPGDLAESGFRDWDGSPRKWLERAEHELNRFDWAPMGDGFWLRLTERGEAQAGGLS